MSSIRRLVALVGSVRRLRDRPLDPCVHDAPSILRRPADHRQSGVADLEADLEGLPPTDPPPDELRDLSEHPGRLTTVIRRAPISASPIALAPSGAGPPGAAVTCSTSSISSSSRSAAVSRSRSSGVVSYGWSDRRRVVGWSDMAGSSQHASPVPEHRRASVIRPTPQRPRKQCLSRGGERPTTSPGQVAQVIAASPTMRWATVAIWRAVGSSSANPCSSASRMS